MSHFPRAHYSSSINSCELAQNFFFLGCEKKMDTLSDESRAVIDYALQLEDPSDDEKSLAAYVGKSAYVASASFSPFAQKALSGATFSQVQLRPLFTF